MVPLRLELVRRLVALRKESVDRNQKLMAALLQNTESLSARRAWIEIGIGGAQQMAVYKVALRKESVDRNMSREMSLIRPYGRSPQGERG